MRNKRLRLLGLLGALTVPLALGTVLPATAISPADANLSPCNVTGNLVRNCGFEATVGSDGVVPGWDHLVSVNSDVTNLGTGAKSGTHALRFGSTSSDDVWTQTVPVLPHTTYVVGASFEAFGGTPDDDLTITLTNLEGSPGSGTVFYSTQNQELSSWNVPGHSVTTGSGRSMTITIAGANTPSETYVDDVFVLAQQSGCAAIANNAVKNCSFEAASMAPWVHSASHSSDLTTGSSYGGAKSLYFTSTGANDVWYQVVTVRPHTTYTLRYWDWYYSDTQAPDNNLTVSLSNVAAPGGQLSVTKTNVANQWWKQVTRTFKTGAASTAVLTLSGNNPANGSHLDDFSLTVAPKVSVAKSGTKVVTTLTGLGGQAVWLQKKSGSHWKLVHVFVAPKSGVAKVWALKVPKGTYRAVAKSAPGYVQVTSNTVKR